jgi:hypothetical protein
MSTKKKDGGPAFPTQSSPYFTGMTLRDWFAGQALTAPWSSNFEVSEAAEIAYEFADAMLAARAKKEDDE